MSNGVYTYYTAELASGTSLSGVFELQRSFENIYLAIPSMVSNSEIYIKAATEEDGTYRRVKHPVINSSTAQVNLFRIASSSTNCLVPIPNGFRFLKVETSATITGGATFQILCGD